VSTYGPHHSPEDVYAATLIGLLGAAAAGTTTVVDWADVPGTEAHIEAVRQAHADAGLRTVFVLPADHGVSLEFATDLLVESELSSVAVGASDPTASTLQDVAAQIEHARSRGLRVHAHAGGEASRGVVATLGERGLLGPDVTLIHCTKLDGADLDVISNTSTPVTLTPSTEMAGGSGSPPMQEFIDRDIPLGLGVDEEGLAPGDVFAQMRAAISIQHATSFDLKLAGKAGIPKLMTTREVIRAGTVDGARAAGLEGVVGTLAPGVAADIVVLRTDRPNIYPINDPIGAVVWGMDTSTRDWVFVGGRPVMRSGELVADVERARSLAIASQRKVGDAVGRLATTQGSGT
jgi:cytosine/adenosine deaminase-related metal-dependent hydrolase